MIQEILLVICLIIIIVYLFVNLYNIVVKESFQTDNLHNCPPNSVLHNPYNSHNSLIKGWCTTNSYLSVSGDNIDTDSFNRSPVKCPASYSRASPLESHNSESKGYCKKPEVYE
jgi:hypothetical protein